MDTYITGYTCISVILSLTQICGSLECAPNQHNLNGLKCCTMCEPGSGVRIPCNQDNDTICEPCRHGETFSAHSSHEKQCKPCKICPQYSYVKHQCNETHDTECECDRNYFWNTDTHSCRQCEYCPMGYGAKRKCDLRRNTVCASCSTGMYSDVISDDSCKLCARCPANQMTIRPCDDMRDTVCVDLPEDKPNYEIMSTSTTTKTVVVVEPEKRTDSKNILIPICIGALGLVIMILLIYVVIKQVRNHRNAANNANSKKNISYSAVNDPMQSHLAHAGVTTQHGSDSGVSLEHEPKSTTRVSELGPVKLQVMCNILHQYPGVWTHFARELRYTPAVIASFETRASQLVSQPAFLVLSEWSKNESATVEALTQVLRSIGREDIIQVIYSDSRSLAMNAHQNYSVQNMSNFSGGPLLNCSGPQNMSHHNMMAMGSSQSYSPTPNYAPQYPPNMVQHPENVIPAHQIITDPHNSAPQPVYLQHGAACSNSSGEYGAPYPNQAQHYQQMHTQPTQGQMV